MNFNINDSNFFKSLLNGTIKGTFGLQTTSWNYHKKHYYKKHMNLTRLLFHTPTKTPFNYNNITRHISIEPFKRISKNVLDWNAEGKIVFFPSLPKSLVRFLSSITSAIAIPTVDEVGKNLSSQNSQRTLAFLNDNSVVQSGYLHDLAPTIFEFWNLQLEENFRSCPKQQLEINTFYNFVFENLRAYFLVLFKNSKLENSNMEDIISHINSLFTKKEIPRFENNFLIKDVFFSLLYHDHFLDEKKCFSRDFNLNNRIGFLKWVFENLPFSNQEMILLYSELFTLKHILSSKINLNEEDIRNLDFIEANMTSFEQSLLEYFNKKEYDNTSLSYIFMILSKSPIILDADADILGHFEQTFLLKFNTYVDYKNTTKTLHIESSIFISMFFSHGTANELPTQYLCPLNGRFHNVRYFKSFFFPFDQNSFTRILKFVNFKKTLKGLFCYEPFKQSSFVQPFLVSLIAKEMKSNEKKHIKEFETLHGLYTSTMISFLNDGNFDLFGNIEEHTSNSCGLSFFQFSSFFNSGKKISYPQINALIEQPFFLEKSTQSKQNFINGMLLSYNNLLIAKLLYRKTGLLPQPKKFKSFLKTDLTRAHLCKFLCSKNETLQQQLFMETISHAGMKRSSYELNTLMINVLSVFKTPILEWAKTSDDASEQFVSWFLKMDNPLNQIIHLKLDASRFLIDCLIPTFIKSSPILNEKDLLRNPSAELKGFLRYSSKDRFLIHLEQLDKIFTIFNFAKENLDHSELLTDLSILLIKASELIFMYEKSYCSDKQMDVFSKWFYSYDVWATDIDSIINEFPEYERTFIENNKRELLFFNKIEETIFS